MAQLYKGSIKVADIPKERIKDGKYLPVDIWLNDEPNEYGSIGSISVYMGQGSKAVYICNFETFENHKARFEKKDSGSDESDGLPF